MKSYQRSLTCGMSRLCCTVSETEAGLRVGGAAEGFLVIEASWWGAQKVFFSCLPCLGEHGWCFSQHDGQHS